METATCSHKETKKPAGRYTLGTCTVCGQETKYPVDRLEGPPVVIKLGHRNGKIVMPDGHCRVQLGDKDVAELDEIAHSSKPAPQEEELPADIPPRPGKDDPRGRVKWFKDNLKQLVAALIKLGAKAFKEKYNFNRQMISHLKASKEYKRQIQKAPAPAKGSKATKRRATRKKTEGNSAVSLPRWNDDWAPEVQLRWLEIYDKHFSK